MNTIAQVLMQGKASKGLDCLQQLGTAPTIFIDFCKIFWNKWFLLDNENMARDKLQTV